MLGIILPEGFNTSWVKADIFFSDDNGLNFSLAWVESDSTSVKSKCSKNCCQGTFQTEYAATLTTVELKSGRKACMFVSFWGEDQFHIKKPGTHINLIKTGRKGWPGASLLSGVT